MTCSARNGSQTPMTLMWPCIVKLNPLRERCSGRDRVPQKRGRRRWQTVELVRLKRAADLAGARLDIGGSPVRDHVVHADLPFTFRASAASMSRSPGSG